MDNGFIKLHRSIFSSDEFVASEMSQREAFIWMLCQCAWVPVARRKGRALVALDRGEFIVTIREMADVFGWSKSRTERFIKRLKSRDTIGTRTETVSGTTRMIVKVNGYRDFQDREKPKRDNDRDSDDRKPGQHKEKKEELPYSRGGVLPSEEHSQSETSKEPEPSPQASGDSAPARVSGGGLSPETLPDEARKALKAIRTDPFVGVSVSLSDVRAFTDAITGWRDGVFLVCPEWMTKHGERMQALVTDAGCKLEPFKARTKLVAITGGKP